MESLKNCQYQEGALILNPRNVIKVSAFSAKAKFKVFCTNASQENIGTQIHDIVQHSNNQEWKVNYASVISDNDALSQDLVYHKQCITE